LRPSLTWWTSCWPLRSPAVPTLCNFVNT